MSVNMTEDQLLVLVIKYLREGKRSSFQLLLEELHPYDFAQLYRGLPEKHRHKFLLFLTPSQIADLIQELDYEMQIEILHKLGIERSSKVMNLMDNDDLADLLNELSLDKIQEFLDVMREEDSEKLQSLMSYPADTAGGLMNNQFVWINAHYTVRQAVDKLKEYASFSENIYYLYVINDEKQLVGVVSYRDLLIANTDEIIEDLMFSRVVAVNVETDQEEVARIIERYDFIAVPVVDHNNVLQGIITVDDAFDIVIREANEDIEKLSASGKDIDFNTKAITASVRRLPWLILLLFIGLVSGSILNFFEETLEQLVALIFFMPMIAGMTGNTGTQSLAVVVRGIVTSEMNKKVVTKLIFRELRVSLIIGITCAALITTIGAIWQADLLFGAVVGVSLFFSLIIGTMAGTIIPLILYRVGVDPAVASGPLITTLNDIFSLLIYFGTATMFLSHILT
ncbi:magnesium transporter [Alkalihalobacillus alcalophilus ATCC 27647 = CGMCC 1.3604]|uniref:Magnesium transporter MgtE n=1 Tax=Alkalihalobacillus alcalophilus ATCC 27647 = CGMCC 1.3604 TaxID=1218173 RepID=J8TPF4_ALKAL|nr:magnesium transporter [Alkalihalobacillus alcalophilus]AFV25892.1 magnesium ion transporter [Alkalihalobacillus alcalophilus ATCC 27647 = CGMCC 1.3604]KGA96224.1 magnesium transporter [Alkalihalobacillus alcalophilus ATCC 27647 = CGMCC 1.3604]MED1562997.1 magnesium transporter [Alkalihalobacillus alcalophilus]THG92319.1 magnesium transporter [Alkalihalobacillus alcalophilus ATCC 27647 = CGMCC 1.3604]